MKENLISLKTAKIAKLKGFDIPCLFYYDKTEEISTMSNGAFDNKNYNVIDSCYSAPTQCVLQKWIREKHNVFVYVEIDRTVEPKFVYSIDKYNVSKENIYDWEEITFASDLYYTHEECLEDGLIQALNILPDKTT